MYDVTCHSILMVSEDGDFSFASMVEEEGKREEISQAICFQAFSVFSSHSSTDSFSSFWVDLFKIFQDSSTDSLTFSTRFSISPFPFSTSPIAICFCCCNYSSPDSFHLNQPHHLLLLLIIFITRLLCSISTSPYMSLPCLCVQYATC